jgi:SAM-dependent methyltransferase
MKTIYDYTEYVNFPCHLKRLEWIYETINTYKKSNTQILDVGCGTGNVTIPLGLVENAQVLGIDIHQGNVDISTNANTFENVKIKFESLFDCDIKNFDFIVLTEVLEHISFYKDILKYLGDNGKKNYQLLITVPNGFGPFEICMQPLYLMRKMGLNGFIWKVKKLLGKKEPYSQNYDTPHVNFFTVSRLKRECKMYGLEVEEVKNAYFLAPIIETYLPFIPLKSISKIDNAIAQFLPHFLASGHYYRIVKK